MERLFPSQQAAAIKLHEDGDGDDSISVLQERVERLKALLFSAILDLARAVETKKDSVLKEKERVEKEKAFMEGTLKLCTPIHLNVGGRHFTTSLQTLTKDKDSMLAAMFSGRWNLPQDEKDGCYFIDRDGKYFRYILNFLRDGDLEELPRNTMKALLKEAKYFQTTSLVCTIEDLLSAPTRLQWQPCAYVIISPGTDSTNLKFGSFTTTVVALPAFSRGVHYWEVRIDRVSTWSWVGVADDNYDPNQFLGSSGWAFGSGGRVSVVGSQRTLTPKVEYDTGDTVGCLLDMNQHTLTYYINGANTNVQICNLPAKVRCAVSNNCSNAEYTVKYCLEGPASTEDVNIDL